MVTARLVLAVIVVLVAASCGSPAYRITLKDGREFIAEGKPEFQKKTGYFQYKNPQGRDALVRADEVFMIVQE